MQNGKITIQKMCIIFEGGNSALQPDNNIIHELHEKVVIIERYTAEAKRW